MATEQQRKQAATRLKQWVEIDKQVVTYRQIARELGVHVNIAKNILLEYHQENPSLYATYHLSGLLLPPGSQYANAQASNGHHGKNGESSKSQQPADAMDVDEEDSFDHVKEQQRSWVNKAVDETDVRPEPVPRYGIVLAGAETYEAKQHLFFPDSLRVHVHSLAFGAIKDPAMYLTPALLLRSHPSYYDPVKYGTISGGAFQAVAPAAPPAMKDGSMSFGSTSKFAESKADSRKAAEVKSEPGVTAPATKVKSAKVKTEETISKTASTAVKKEGTASAMYTNSSGTKPPPAATSGNKSGADPNLKGKLKGKAVRRIDSEEEEEPEEEKPQPVPAKSKTQEGPKTASTENEEMLNAMFDMPIDIDDDDYADIEDAAPPNQEAKKSQKKAPVKKRPSTAQPQDTDMSGDDTASRPKSASGRPRKRRRVTKTETSIDDKGYMVTKNVSGSESYSSSGEETNNKAKAKPKAKPSKSDSASTTTVDAKPKPKPKPAPPAKKGGKPGQQSSLMGFFTKKP